MASVFWRTPNRLPRSHGSLLRAIPPRARLASTRSKYTEPVNHDRQGFPGEPACARITPLVVLVFSRRARLTAGLGPPPSRGSGRHVLYRDGSRRTAWRLAGSRQWLLVAALSVAAEHFLSHF